MPKSGSEASSSGAGRAPGMAMVAGLCVAAVVGVGLLAFAGLAAAGWVPGIGKPDYSKISAGDLGSLAVAGATLLLADFTAVLAWFTRRAIGETQREARVAEAALTAARRQADIAEKSLAAAQEQAKIGERQVEATNAQARIAQEQLVASWRPLLGEPASIVTVGGIQMYVVVPFRNIGTGPAFVTKGSPGNNVDITLRLG